MTTATEHKTARPVSALTPGVAPIIENAPRVTSRGSSAAGAPFAALLEFRARTETGFTLRKGKRSAKLLWPGLTLTASELAELLKKLSRDGRIDGAIRAGGKVSSLCMEAGRLKRSPLKPPADDGLVLYWKIAPEAITTLQVEASQRETHEPAPFQPAGERLARFSLTKGGCRAVAILYRRLEPDQPDLVFTHAGQPVGNAYWPAVLPEERVEAPHCQVVLEGDLPSPERLPEVFKRQLAKLARLAARRSAEVGPPAAPPPPSSPESSDLVERLLQSPRFQAAYGSLKEGKPPLVTLTQILELVAQGGGQIPLAAIRERIGLPEHRLTTILEQMHAILRGPHEVVLSLSIDGRVLVLDRDRLIRLFALGAVTDDPHVVRSESMEGEPRVVRLPFEITLKERRVLEALLRYGKLSEQELSQITGSRRVGGLLQRLLSRLESDGFYGLRVVAEGAEGRIFALQ